MGRTFFHASPKSFEIGLLLCPGMDGGWSSRRNLGPAEVVYLAGTSAPHLTILEMSVREDWLIYEVEPVGAVRTCKGNGEFQADAAIIVRCLGYAKDLAKLPVPGSHFDSYSGLWFSWDA